MSDDGEVTVIKDLGLVSQVFDEQMLSSLTGEHAIGHVRYSTTGATAWQNSQPLVRARNGGVVALGHNGNLVNTTALRDELVAEGVRFTGTTDTEVITALIAHEAEGDLLGAVRTAVAKIRGAFSAAVLSGDALVGFRDPYGVRPLCLGDYEGNPVISSETARLRHHRRPLRARDPARRDRHRRRRARPAQRARRARGLAPGALHLRVHLLRPARLRARRPHPPRVPPRRWAGASPRRRRSRPTS